MSTDQNQVTDEFELPEEKQTRLDELYKKSDLNEDEQKEFDEIKKERTSRYGQKIGKLTKEAREAQELYGKASQQVEELRQEIEELKKTRESSTSKPDLSTRETIQVGNKQFYTDNALNAMVQSGQINENDAYRHQQDRLKEEASEAAYQRLKSEKTQEDAMQTLQKDRDQVLRDYPQFDNKHPDYNPNDPLYKEANSILQEFWPTKESMLQNPRAMSKAISLAKRALRIDEKKPDISDDLNVGSPTAPGSQKTEGKSLSEEDKEIAWRMYRDQTNPSTGRRYTEKEAHEKFKKARERRPARRVAA